MEIRCQVELDSRATMLSVLSGTKIIEIAKIQCRNACTFIHIYVIKGTIIRRGHLILFILI